MDLEVTWKESPVCDVHLLNDGTVEAEISEDLLSKTRLLIESMKAELHGEKLYPIAEKADEKLNHRFRSELEFAADTVGCNWQDVMLANLVYDLIADPFGCSTMVIPTANGPLIARNMDFFPECLLAQASVLNRYHQNGKFQFAIAGWPGGFGVVTGMSANGFAVILNAAMTSDELSNPDGFPVLIQLRRTLEDATDFSEALLMLQHETLATGGLLTLVGTSNAERVVIERTPTRHALRWPANSEEVLITTNDYRLLYEPQQKTQSSNSLEIYQTTCQRYDFLSKRFAGHTLEKNYTDLELLSVLTDSNVMQSITAQHILMRPAESKIEMFVPLSLVER